MKTLGLVGAIAGHLQRMEMDGYGGCTNSHSKLAKIKEGS